MARTATPQLVSSPDDEPTTSVDTIPTHRSQKKTELRPPARRTLMRAGAHGVCETVDRFENVPGPGRRKVPGSAAGSDQGQLNRSVQEGRHFMSPESCGHCYTAKATCLIPLFGRATSCSECQRTKRQCSVGGKVRGWVASGKFGTSNDPYAEISTVEDVRALGLDRASEIVLSQLVLVKQRIRNLELKLDAGLSRIERLLSVAEPHPVLHQAQPRPAIDVDNSGNDGDDDDDDDDVTTTDNEYVDKPNFNIVDLGSAEEDDY